MGKKIGCFLLALVLALATSAPALAAGPNDAKISVVRILVNNYITVKDADGDSVVAGASSWGSGFAVGLANQPVSYFVTNAHVVSMDIEDEDGTLLGYYDYQECYAIFDNINNMVPVSVAAFSDRADLAAVKLRTPTSLRKPASIRTFRQLESTAKAYAIGFPGVSDQRLPGNEQNQYYSTLEDMSVTDGTVSRVIDGAMSKAGELIQMSTPINPGNSGGPLVDERGYVLGVNTSTFVGASNTSHAVSSNEVARFLDSEGIPYIKAGLILSPWLIGLGIIVLASAVVLFFIFRQLRQDQSAKRKKPDAQHGRVAPAAPKGDRTLVGVEGPLAGKRYEVGSKLVIGRDTRKCKVAFPQGTPGVSALHCTLRFDGTRVTVTDEGSSYGTRIGEEKLAAGKPNIMHRGQTLYIGSSENSFTLQ